MRQKIGAFARPSIDHACAASAFLDQFDDPLVPASALAFGAEGQFWTGETVHKFGGIGQMQLGADIVPRSGIGGGGDGQPWHSGKDLSKAAKGAIFGPKIMAPLANAVGLIDRDQGDLHL
ncbi:MAG: hypothetical protein RLZZ141_2308 [Pseudomonadota bacterium]